jgi:uncharacterized repeat protein (TIGR02543 family)
VTSIGDSAFEDCDSLTSITVGGNNTAYQSIDGNLYTKDGTTLIQYARGKTATEFVIPDSVTTIGFEAFAYCDGLTSVEIGDSVTTIGERAFYDCDSLTSVVIGEGVTTIGNSAFYDCDGLTSVVIPDSVTSIGYNAFSYCDSLLIICEAEEQPSGWAYSWNDSDRPVYWGWGNETEYTYTFVVNGGEAIETIVSKYPISLPTPTKEGYWFGGWYDNAELKGKDYSVYYASSDVTFYARWFSTEEAYLEWWHDGRSEDRAMNMECDDEVTIEDAGDVVYFTFTPTTSGNYYFQIDNASCYVDFDIDCENWSSGAGGSGVWSSWWINAGETCRITVAKYNYEPGEFTFTFRITKN